MRDNQGNWQVFLMSPQGGEPRQATFLDGGVDTGVRWHPTGNFLVTVAGTRIIITDVQPGTHFGESRILSDRAPAPFALVLSHDGKKIAYNRRIRDENGELTHIFIDNFPSIPMEVAARFPAPVRKIVPITIGAMPNASTFGKQVYFGGQPQEADFEKFARQGIQTVINLRTSAEMEQLAFNERVVVERAGMKYVHVPIGREPPAQDGLQTVMTVLEGAQRSHVLLHCARSNRVGYVWALYRGLHHGLSPEAAIREGKKAGLRSPKLEQWARQTLAKQNP
jgi:uncharacterized protein (TIGR01244 family)